MPQVPLDSILRDLQSGDAVPDGPRAVHSLDAIVASLPRSGPRLAYADETGFTDDGFDDVIPTVRAELAGYARALIDSGRDEVRFVHLDEAGQWLSVYMHVEMQGQLRPRVLVRSEPIDPAFGLTLRELDVLTLVAAGFGNEAVAVRLDIKLRTVTKHVENIFAKTKISTRAGLASMATDRGLLRLPTPGGCDGYPLGTGQIERLTRALQGPASTRDRRMTLRPILIGMPLSISGRGGADAVEMLNGATLAVEQVNREGGVNGREVQLVVADVDISAASSVETAYRRLIDTEVDAITAGYSCVEPAIQKLVGDFKGPYLHAATMESVVNSVREDISGLGNIFQVCASDVNYGLGLARFLTGLELSNSWTPRNRKLVVLQPFWPGLNIGLDELDRGLDGKGWRIEVVSDLPDHGAPWDTVMDRLHRLDPSVVVLASYFVEDGIALQKAFMASPIAALLYKLYSPSIPAYRSAAGVETDGVIWATTTGLYNDRIGNRFSQQYRQRFGREPGRSHAGIAYDRVRILTGAWARAGHSRLFDRVVEDLRTTVHRGVNGSYYFGAEGQVGLAFPDDTQDPSISQAHLVFQIQDGRQRILSPSPYCDGRFRTPRWLLAQ